MKKVIVLLSAAFLFLLFGVCSYAASYTDAQTVAYDVPVTAVLPDGTHLKVVKYKGNYLCLPGNIDINDVTLVYTGGEQLYLPDTDTFVSFGESFTLDLKVGQVTLYEYISKQDCYYSYSLTVMQGSAVSSLYINFDEGYSFEVLTYLAKSKENAVSGSLLMTDKSGEVLYDGALDTFKCRGNSSFGSPGLQGDKRSYNLKLAEKCELIEGAGEMKKWSLLHMRIDTGFDYDLTGLTTVLGLRTYAELCDEDYYTNNLECVDVYIEGEYRGAYLLVERLDVNAAVDITDSEKNIEGEETGYDRVSDRDDTAIAKGVQWYIHSTGVSAAEEMDITGGYILEISGSPDRCGFSTARGVTFEIKAPEVCTREQVQYIASYVQDFEDALYSKTGYNSEGKHYSEYMDIKSMADCVLTYAFYQNWELMRTSTYIYKDVEGSSHEKLTFGPVWDFETGAHTLMEDLTLFGTHHFYDEYRQYAWIEQMWKKADFMMIASERAQAISGYMHSMLDGEEGAVYDIVESQLDSMTMNWTRWGVQRSIYLSRKFPELDNTYLSQAEFHIDALRTRLDNWDKYWSDEYLLGAEAVSEYDAESGEHVLTVISKGEATDCQWFRINDDGETEMIEGADDFVYVTAEPGDYYCTVSGKNNAFCKNASSYVFSERVITMALTYTVSEPDVTDTDGGFSPWLFTGIGGVVVLLTVATALFVWRRRKK